MNLESWQKNKWLREHLSSREEVADLFRVIDRNLSDCQVVGLSQDGQFVAAYLAALQAATVALAAAGYRPGKGESGHYYTIESLRLTIGLDAATVEKLQGFRKKRNAVTYDKAGMISEQEAQEVRELAVQLRKDVEGWLRANHPHLLPP